MQYPKMSKIPRKTVLKNCHFQNMSISLHINLKEIKCRGECDVVELVAVICSKLHLNHLPESFGCPRGQNHDMSHTTLRCPLISDRVGACMGEWVIWHDYFNHRWFDLSLCIYHLLDALGRWISSATGVWTSKHGTAVLRKRESTGNERQNLSGESAREIWWSRSQLRDVRGALLFHSFHHLRDLVRCFIYLNMPRNFRLSSNIC